MQDADHGAHLLEERACVDELRVGNIVARNLKVVTSPGLGELDVIVARAVAPLSQLLQISHHLSTKKTVWALPKGRGAQSELAEAESTWQGVFHVEQSVTDRDSYIVVGTGVRRK